MFILMLASAMPASKFTSGIFKLLSQLMLRIRDVLSRIRIPDPGGNKAPDPGFGSATLRCNKSIGFS
jgi:hypothetical protein